MNKQLVNWLENWLGRKPPTATILRVTVKGMGSRDTISEHVGEEMEKDARLALATAIVEDCERWADSNQKETTFYVQWLEGELIKATQFFKVSPLNDGIQGAVIDGSPESIISCLQAANLQMNEEIRKVIRTVSDLLVQQSEALQANVELRQKLENENLKLKEALLESSENDSAWKKELISTVKGLLPNPALLAQGVKSPGS